jgi:hypothetical protein
MYKPTVVGDVSMVIRRLDTSMPHLKDVVMAISARKEARTPHSSAAAMARGNRKPNRQSKRKGYKR